MTRDPEQCDAALRREVRRQVEAATPEQLRAMREAWEGYAEHEIPRRGAVAPVFRRGANWTDPGADVPCFIGRASSETCIGCGEHIADHFGRTEYRCSPRTEQTATPQETPVAPEVLAEPHPAFVPGQRVTIPARYLGEGNHGVRVGVALGLVVDGRAFIDVPGHGEARVPIGEVEP